MRRESEKDKEPEKTESEKFEDLARKLVQVPKDEVDEAKRWEKERNQRLDSLKQVRQEVEEHFKDDPEGLAEYYAQLQARFTERAERIEKERKEGRKRKKERK